MIKKNKNSGFTLIEMLVVVFVLGVGLIGALSFFNININNQFEAKNELIAAGLAQEGADLMRNIRDYSDLNGIEWKNDGFGPILNPSCKTIDYESLSSHQCIKGSSLSHVCINSSGRYYQCADGTSGITDFERTISVKKDGEALEIVCEVKWNGRVTQAKDYLYKNSF